MSIFKQDRAKTLASQLASKGYYSGEAVGFKFGRASGECGGSGVLVIMVEIALPKVWTDWKTRDPSCRSEKLRC